ncbi:MAG: sulfite exporter TauE/SafE family protein [Actinomycetota bacterium]
MSTKKLGVKVMTFVAALGIGLVAGAVTGLIGASGVMVIVPGLTLLGYSAAGAIGASLSADAIASLVVAWTYYQNKNLNLTQGWWIVLGSVAGAQIGSVLSPRIPDVGLGNAFGIFLLVTAVVFWVRGARGIKPGEPDSETEEHAPSGFVAALRRHVVASGIGLGLLVGIMSGVLGAGGGVMILLILVFVMGYKMHEGVGTSTLIMAFTAASGAIGHAMTGDLPLRAAAVASLGTVVGGRVAARYANRVNEAVLSKVVGAVFGLLGVAMVVQML